MPDAIVAAEIRRDIVRILDRQIGQMRTHIDDPVDQGEQQVLILAGTKQLAKNQVDFRVVIGHLLELHRSRQLNSRQTAAPSESERLIQPE